MFGFAKNSSDVFNPTFINIVRSSCIFGKFEKFEFELTLVLKTDKIIFQYEKLLGSCLKKLKKAQSCHYIKKFIPILVNRSILNHLFKFIVR